MSQPREIAGVLPVLQTPYHESEQIDFQTLADGIDWLYDAGADGVVVAMVSEILRLDSAERMALVQAVCRQGRERGVVVISVGAESSAVAERYASHAEEMGADAVMAIPPVSIPLGDAELMRYYFRIIKATALPVIVQDASGYVGRPLSIELQSGLLQEFGPERVYFKPEATPIGPRLSALREATGGQARVFEGTGGVALVDSFRRGIVGTMPGADLIHGIVALWRALEAEDESRIYQLSLPISALIAAQSSLDAFLAIEKYLLVRQGVFSNAVVRGPVGYILDEETQHEIDRLFNQVMTAVEAAK